MGQNSTEDSLIHFDDLDVAAAHAHMLGRSFEWIAADSPLNNNLIYGFNVKPELGDLKSTEVWSYSSKDRQSLIHEYTQPIGIYTGDIPWHHTLQTTIRK